MARVEGHDGRAHLRLVVWGPPCARKSQMLERLHAACEAPARGGRIRLEEGSNAAGQVEYAFLDLPPWDRHAMRLHCLTAGDTAGLEDLRRRLLAETDAVLFVAHLGVEQLPETIASWQELAGHLDALGKGSGSLPLSIVVEGDPDGLYRGRAELPTALGVATPRLPGEVLGVHPPDEAIAAAQSLVAAAVLRAFPRDGDVVRGRIAYEGALARRFAARDSGHGPRPRLPWESDGPDEDAPAADAEAGASKELTRWMQVREADLATVERERALRHLLIEIGRVCAEAVDTPALARAVLVRLVMNLDAVNAWLGFERPEGPPVVYDSRGPVADAASLDRVASRLLQAAVPQEPVTLSSDALQAFGGADQGIMLSFTMPPGRRAWMLVTADPAPGLPSGARGLITSAASFVGLAVARLDALEAARTLNQDLEQRVRERTQALRRQKERLEERVRARTRDLESTKRTAMARERRLLDAERREGVHRLAAGVAHELNNPLAALSASLGYVGEVLDEWAGGHVVDPVEVEELREAVRDGLADAARMERLVASLFGSAARSRREAVRTDLGATLREAARHAEEAASGRLELLFDEAVPVFVGIPPGELTRWLFRLLTSLSEAQGEAIACRIVPVPDGPALCISLPCSPGPEAQAALADIAQESAEAGGSLEVETGGLGCVVTLALPPGVGSLPPAPQVHP